MNNRQERDSKTDLPHLDRNKEIWSPNWITFHHYFFYKVTQEEANEMTIGQGL